MNDEQIKNKREEKIRQIEKLCAELQITITPEQAIIGNNIIRNVIFYTDNETYPTAPAATPVRTEEDETSF